MVDKQKSFELQVSKELRRLKACYFARQEFKKWVEDRERPKPVPEIPDRAPIPDYIKNPIARQALGATPTEPILEAAKFDEWQAAISDREAKQHAINCSPAGALAFENDFLRSEEQRRAIVDEMLHRGLIEATIAPAVSWRLEDVHKRRKELGL
jgi:hypothetical protein